MLLGQEYIQKPNGLIVTRSYYNFNEVWKQNHELRKEMGDGFSKEREMRHKFAIPAELADVDPLVAAALEGDRVCQRLMAAKYPQTKVCDGNI
jgi:hypothetical protein